MGERYYIVLTSGEYSDYGIDGLYYADHLLNQDEFDTYVREYNKESSHLWNLYWLNREDASKAEAARVYDNENNPSKVWILKHNLIPVDYVEYNY